MKTAILSVSLVAALMTGGAHAQTTKLIDPGTGAGDDIKNGGFESPAGGGNVAYGVLEDWFNYPTGSGTPAAAGNGTFIHTGTRGGSVSRPSNGISHPAVNTGYTIAAGDTFSLTFWYKGDYQWDDNIDTVTATLYSTSGDIWSHTVAPLTTSWQSYTANNIAAANIGETLFLRFQASPLDVNEFSAIDDVTLEVTAAPRGTLISIF